MSHLVIFKSSFVHGLRSSVKPNLAKYGYDKSWTHEIGPRAAREMQTGVEINGTLTLANPKDGNLMDIENAIRVHGALRHLTPLQARDPRLWTHLTHVECWEYMHKRWPVEKHMSKGDRASRFVLSRYFVAQSQSRALLRNGIARLWWTSHVSCDIDRDNPYELTTVLLSTLDITQQILERGLGRAPRVIQAFLEFLLRNKEPLLTGGDRNRTRIRRLAKFLNMHGGICVLDCLSKAEVMDLLEEEFARVLDAESKSSEESHPT